MPNKLDLTGQVFGRLTAIKTAGKNEYGNYLWVCRCECGNETVTPVNSLRTGGTTSCGCLQIERVLATHITHGMSKHPLYGTWHMMTQRCHNPDAHAYELYGGRGIKVSDEFRDTTKFIEYVDKELGPKPSNRHSLDRINNDLGYERGNLRWATKVEQARNRRGSISVHLCGEEVPLKEAFNIFGVSRSKGYYRLAAGWPLVDVLLGKPKRAAA